MSLASALQRTGLAFLALLFLVSGVCHFLLTPFFVAIMPPWAPMPRAAVHISGAFEIAGALGLVATRTRRAAGIGLFALTICVTPANVHMWLHPELFPAFSAQALFWRLPAQVVLLAVIWRCAIARRAADAAKIGLSAR